MKGFPRPGHRRRRDVCSALEMNRGPLMLGGMRLQQGQVWKLGEEYLRIVQVERLKVGYKLQSSLTSREGHHREATKKEFCRLIKTATLLTPVQVLEASAK